MPHIFFNKLEQRQSTQSFLPFYQFPFDTNYTSFGSPYNVLEYGIGIPSPQTGVAPYGFGPSYQYPWSPNWGWSSWGPPQISSWSSPWQSNGGWFTPSWGIPQYSSWSSPWQSNGGWSSWGPPQISSWSTPWQSNWGWSTPAPSNPPWSPSSPWTGSDNSYPPGTLYGLVKRSNLLHS